MTSLIILLVLSTFLSSGVTWRFQLKLMLWSSDSKTISPLSSLLTFIVLSFLLILKLHGLHLHFIPFGLISISFLNCNFPWCALYKPLGEVVQYGKRYEQNLIPWSSFSTTDTFSAVLYGGFARSKQLSSNEQCLINSIGNFLAVASAMGYPNDFLRQKLKMWCHKNNLKIDEKCWAHAPMTQSRLLHKSFSEPEVTFPVGSFSVSKL